MIFKTVEQITNKFIKDGWSKNTSFEELKLQEAEKEGLLFAIAGIKKGKKYFKMNINNNIYDDNGKIVLYNIPVKKNNINNQIKCCFYLIFKEAKKIATIIYTLNGNKEQYKDIYSKKCL